MTQTVRAGSGFLVFFFHQLMLVHAKRDNSGQPAQNVQADQSFPSLLIPLSVFYGEVRDSVIKV